MKINALCTDKLDRALEHCDSVVYCGDRPVSDARVTVYAPYCAEASDNIYVPSLCDENVLEGACDYLVSNDVRAIVRAAYDLNEAGMIEARYKLSPVMLLHRLGVLGKCAIAGGVCLDNDDLDLMAQEGVPLILLPTASAGYGHGFAPVVAALKRGLRVGVGTFDGKYNDSADLAKELEFLSLTANAEMRSENALSAAELKAVSGFTNSK